MNSDMPAPSAGTDYGERVVDSELDALLPYLPAISLEGPKGVGKTATALRRCSSVIRLDDEDALAIARAEPGRIAEGDEPILLDEWQRYPASWDVIRRAVDADSRGGRFLLTGSATPIQRPTHSGAGRIVSVRMRPLTLPERGIGSPTVSLAATLSGSGHTITGRTDVTLSAYTAAIVGGGFPGMRRLDGRARRAALDGYLTRVVDVDLVELGADVRRPETLRRWLTAYAAATSTTASWDSIRDAATGGEDTKPSKAATSAYREILERIWILDSVPAWAPTRNRLTRLTSAPKHQLADPALAARLAGIDADALLRADGPTKPPRDGSFLGALFESLATLSVRVFAQSAEARVGHCRTKGGEHEIDLVVTTAADRVVGIEVKLSATVSDADVRHLVWLRDRLGDDFIDGMVLTTGSEAYRRPDGIAVVPLALLGP